MFLRGPPIYLRSTQAQERVTKLSFMINERKILHDLEYSPKFRHFVIDIFTEKSWHGVAVQGVKAKGKLNSR
jgi:hypothetical protein